MLALQKSKASFRISELSYILYGGKHKYQEFQSMLTLFENDQILKYNPSFLNQARAETMTIYAKKLIRFHQFFPLDGSNQELKTNLFCHSIPLSVHAMMFLMTLQNLSDQQQKQRFLQPALRGQILGCYAQTELAHGSDVQSLLTTATYRPQTQSFIINTPRVEATKWWIGDLGLYCNHAIVFAQLIIRNKSYGVHAFLVPIRNPQTLRPLQGIQVGDVGPKSGFHNKDNGYVIFNNVEIGRRNMLMKYHVVSKEGEYRLQGNEKISYATMLLTRSNLTKIIKNSICKITTIGIRYSLLRTQFKNSQGQEIPILNYQTQQQKLIPRIAQSYAAWFTGKAMTELSKFVQQEAHRGKFERLNEAHILASATKAVLSYDVLRGAQIVRRSLGGHGFHSYSGVVAIQQESTPVITIEGQFTVLLLQVGRFMLKSLSNLQKGKKLQESVQYLQQLMNDSLLVTLQNQQSLEPLLVKKLLVSHSCAKIRLVGSRYAQLLGERFTGKQIENYQAGIAINEAAIAHAYVVIYSFFDKEVQKIVDSQIKAVLSKLLVLYGIQKIVQNCHKFYQTQTLTPTGLSMIYNKRERLFEQIRPECLGLVQAFGYSDSMLMSAIASSNGQPYQNLIEWAQKYNPLNGKLQRDQIVEVIKKAKGEMRPKL